MGTLIEEYRKQCIENVFNTATFSAAFSTWKTKISSLVPHRSAKEFFDLGDHLREIFNTTNTTPGRSQETVSGGGACWEGLICWYLNLCNIGRRTIVIKHSKDLIPQCISYAITVNYGNFPSNTESDLIAITFPNLPEYNLEVSDFSLIDTLGKRIPCFKGKARVPNVKAIIDVLAQRDFAKLEVNVIQCKTNWNDNAQIPMLWDMIYSTNSFRSGRSITIGRNGFSIKNLDFKYSFVTVPSNKIEIFKEDSTCVKRVENLTGGNYWGCPTKDNVAASIKEILNRNLHNGATPSHLSTLSVELPKLISDYSYFNI